MLKSFIIRRTSTKTLSSFFSSHAERITDQFTKQAVPFSHADAIRNLGIDQILAFVDPTSEDSVLDVACGGGILTTAFAKRVLKVTGIDMTTAMLTQAKTRCQQENVSANTHFILGDVLEILKKTPTSSLYTVCFSRFAFHHFENPTAVLSEMKRVCKRGGKIVVVDVEAPADSTKAKAFNEMEKLRDPSHVRALSLAELKDLFAKVSLPTPRVSGYLLKSTLDVLLARSFPLPGDADKIREIFAKSMIDNRLGIPMSCIGKNPPTTFPSSSSGPVDSSVSGTIKYAYPVVILISENL